MDQLTTSLTEKLRCPLTQQHLVRDDESLSTPDKKQHYRISSSGIPLFAEQLCSEDAKRQQRHYEKVAANYIDNLAYPHTQEYMGYLDRVFREVVSPGDLLEAAEICCGRGELLALFGADAVRGVGVDISPTMLQHGQSFHNHPANFLFVQGDATNLPLGSGEFSGIFMLGGIHHVADRPNLFREAFRILRPGGHLYWREPVSDFFLWRWLRSVIYRLSPALDAETERPLRFRETVPHLEAVGFELVTWKTYGFLGFCLFMNSDVLVFNRFFRFLPGIRAMTRLAIGFDDLLRKLPGFGRSGLQVIGVARKPMDVER